MTSLFVESRCYAQSAANSISFHVEHNSSTEMQIQGFHDIVEDISSLRCCATQASSYYCSVFQPDSFL